MWTTANSSDAKRLQAISKLMAKHSELICFVFEAERPLLRASPRSILRWSRTLSSGEQVLVRIALDLWNYSGEAQLRDLYLLDSENFENALAALQMLRARG